MPRIEVETGYYIKLKKLYTPPNNKYKSILKEKKSYKATKRLPPTLTHLHDVLNITRPNSIDAEIVFSAVMTQLMLQLI